MRTLDFSLDKNPNASDDKNIRDRIADFNTQIIKEKPPVPATLRQK